MIIYVKKGQTLFDIALQYYGKIEAVYSIISDNPIIYNITSFLPAGTALNINVHPDFTDERMLRIIKNKNIQPASESATSEWILATGYWNDNGIWLDNENWKDF